MKILINFLLVAAIVVSEAKFIDERDKPSTAEPRIVGGFQAKTGQFPYQVGLQIYFSGDSTFCGGTLISKSSVLSAAHCCDGAESITVILGSVEIFNRTEPHRKIVKVPKQNIKVHENWNSEENINDICLLKLPTNVELSQYIAIADLPRDDSRDFTRQNVVASGWGRISDENSLLSPVLKYAQMTVLSNYLCNFYYMGSVRATNVCTNGMNGISTCNGDSGGPIVLERTHMRNAVVIGITSYGTSLGCEARYPSVYTRVSKYLRWIKKNMS